MQEFPEVWAVVAVVLLAISVWNTGLFVRQVWRDYHET